jgi:hypothetical protein
LLDAYCPHLGAHLGKGGTVTDAGAVRCPFHGFAFDRGGVCVATAYGSKPPPTAVLASYPVEDRNGLLLAWFDPDGKAPGWHIPELDLGRASAWATTMWDLRGHPQETSENSVDLGHFGEVHGYQDLVVGKKASTAGPVLQAEYSFIKPLLTFAGRRLGVQLDIEVNVFGLGVSVVNARVPRFGLGFRLLVLPTPVEAGRIHLRIGLSVKDHAILPRLLTRAAMPGLLLKVYENEIEQDFEVWRHKRFASRPALAAGDGPIGLYRQWTRQFYAASPTA